MKRWTIALTAAAALLGCRDEAADRRLPGGPSQHGMPQPGAPPHGSDYETKLPFGTAHPTGADPGGVVPGARADQPGYGWTPPGAPGAGAGAAGARPSATMAQQQGTELRGGEDAGSGEPTGVLTEGGGYRPGAVRDDPRR